MATSASIEVSRPASDVFAFLLDIENESKWKGDVKSVRLEAGNRGEVGGMYVEEVVQAGTKMFAKVELTDVVPGERVAYNFRLGPIKGQATLTVGAAGDSTSSMITFALDLGRGLMVKAAGGRIDKMVQEDLATLKEVLECDPARTN